jgi:hypothetical protein
MGKPFSAILNCFFTLRLWAPGVRHALICYADHKSITITKAIHEPKWTERKALSSNTQLRPQSRQSKEPRVQFNQVNVGANGTRFRAKG